MIKKVKIEFYANDKKEYIEKKVFELLDDLIASDKGWEKIPKYQDNYKFEQETSGRTYFKDIDAAYDDHDWFGYDTDDDTTVGNSINIASQNTMAGLIVPYDCKLKGVRWIGENTANYDNVVHLQTWTGASIGDGDASNTVVAITLRSNITLTDYKRKYYNQAEALDVAMDAGQMVYPAFQYVSGTQIIFHGSVVFLLERA